MPNPEDFSPLFANNAEGKSTDLPSGNSYLNEEDNSLKNQNNVDDYNNSYNNDIEDGYDPAAHYSGLDNYDDLENNSDSLPSEILTQNTAQNYQDTPRKQEYNNSKTYTPKEKTNFLPNSTPNISSNFSQSPYLTREQRAEKELLERLPPHSITAEKSIIGGIFLDASTLNSLVDIVKPEDFYVPAHVILFKAFLDLYKNAKPIDYNTLLIYLESRQELETIGGAVYLSEIAESYISEESAKYYAELVRDKAMQRVLIKASTEIITNSYNPAAKIDELLNESERSIFSISERKSAKTFESIGALTGKIFELATQRADQKTSVTGLSTDFTQLDSITAGLQASDLIILAARPAMGKTAFALNLAMNTAVNHGNAVAIFSLEMSATSLAERMISLWSKVELTKLKRGFLDDGDWLRLHKAASEFDSAPIFIDDTGELNTLALRAKCRRLKSQHGLKLVIVDYLQLMRSSRTDSRELEISDISRNLKALAKELDIPVLALSQLNRKLEERTDKRPLLSDLRESGAIEQDADIIMFIHREDVYKKDKTLPNTNIAEIIIGKHRNGATGVVNLTFLSQFTAFENTHYEQITT